MDNYDGYVKIGTKIDTKELKDQLQNVQKSLKDAGDYFKSLGKEGASSFKEIESQFKSIDASAKITGNEIKAIGDKKEVLQKKIDSLIKSGLKPEDLQIKALKKTYDELTKAQEINTKQTEAKSKTLKQSLGNIKTSYLAFASTITAVVLVVSKFVKLLGSLNDAYMVQASAERALATAAKNNPYLNDKSVQNLKAYASELQKVSNYGDEVTIGLMTQLAAAGRTEAEIQKIIKASADLAASGTTTFDGAVKNLNKTFSGLSGELGEVIPELKNLTAEQMKNGDAVDLIAKKYEGMAASVVDKSVQIQNALGDLKEVIGEIGASTGLTDMFQNALLAITEFYTSGLEMFDDWVRRMRGTKEYSLEVLKETREERYRLVKEERKAITEINEKFNNETDKNTKNLLMQALRQRMATLAQMEDGIKMIDAEIAEKEKEIAEREKENAEQLKTVIKDVGEEEKKREDGRIAAQQQYEAAVNLATEKQKGGLITLEEKWDDIKSAAEDYTDALINLGYTYEETATIGGKALEDMRRKLTGNDLSKGLGFAGVIGGEGATGFNNIINDFTSTLKNTGNIFLNSIKKVIIDEPLKAAEEASKEAIAISARATAEAAKQTASKANKESANIAKIYKDKIIEATGQVKQLYEIASAAMADGNVELYQKAVDSMKTYSEQIEEYKIKVSAAGRGAVNSIESAFSDNVNSAVLIVKDFTKNVAGAFSAGLSIAKNIVSGIFTAIKAMATFSPKEIIDDIKTTFEGLTEFFNVELPLLDVYFASGATIIREFLRGMIEGLPNTVETIKNVLTEIFDNIKENIEEDTTSALTVASALLLAIVSALPEAIETIGAIASAIIKAIVTIAPELIKGIVEGLIEILPVALDTVITFLEDWFDTMPDLAGKLVEVIVGMVPDMVSLLIQSIPKILQLMNPLNAEMIALWMTILAKILPDLFVLPINIWTGIIDGIATLLIGVLDEMVLFLDDPEAWADMKLSFIENMAEALIEAKDEIWDKVKSAFMGLIDKIGGLFKGLGYVLEKALKLDVDGDGFIGEPANGDPKMPIYALEKADNRDIDGDGFIGDPAKEVTTPTPPVTTPPVTTPPVTTPPVTTPPVTTPPVTTPPVTTPPVTTPPENPPPEKTEKRKLTATIKKVNFFTKKPTEVEANGKKYDGWEEFAKYIFSLPIPQLAQLKFMGKLQERPIGSSLTMEYAKGTSYAEGGLSKINEPYSELVELPTGSKVMTANATAGLVEQAVQSVMRGLGGFEGQQKQRPIVLHNYMESVMNVNGKVLGKIAFENIDRNVRMQYGN